MQNVEFVLSSLFLCVISNFNIGYKNQVEAKKGEVLPLGSLLGSWERRHLYHFKDTQAIENVPRDGDEYEKAEFPEFQIRHTKKKPKLIKKNKVTAKHVRKFVRRKKKAQKRKIQKNHKKFVESTPKDIDDTDSKMSNSMEIDKQGKPVDIIVHIKMND